ncbi:NADH-quinone oxidoreductase subunit L [Thermoleophilia bacterium SCSIO 60948]|nr:NADH-quinone oxidoreductase subunit L [Thermoleophilia bacterium SCSIO 60948]
MQVLLWLTVLVPAAAALTVALARPAARSIAVAGALAAAVPAWVLVIAAAGGEEARSAVTWLPAGDLEAGLMLDGLAAAMSAIVASVGLVVVVYATGYFRDRAASALTGLLAFLAAMQGLVLAEGFLTLLVFWELVGALSARLIAFSRDDSAAAPGAVRAFLTTRAADVGLYAAVLALLAGSGTLAFGAGRPDGALGALVGVGLVLAAMGKSAQAPLHTWLAGAMAGPTPVSALLHSATMVAAGVFLLVRSGETLAGWPLALAGWVGALTAVAGAAIALAQTDLKRVLAGSTTSQLGLMFVGVAAGGPAVAIFHLVCHAAGKAALFLSAGIFQHDRHSTSLTALAGAGRGDRTTFALFAVGAASIAAVPPLAAFWSKDAIVVAAESNPVWLVLVLLAAAGSAAYLLRPALVLWRRVDHDGTRSRSGRRTMLAATGVLAVASLGLGVLGGPIAELLGAPAPETSTLSVALSLAALVLGAAAVLAAPRLPAAAVAAAREQLYANQLLRGAVQRPALALARALDVADRRVVNAAVDGVARGGLALARAEDRVERRGIDAAVDGLARLVGRGGHESTRVQTGRLHEYLRDTLLGVGALAFILLLTAVV